MDFYLYLFIEVNNQLSAMFTYTCGCLEGSWNNGVALELLRVLTIHFSPGHKGLIPWLSVVTLPLLRMFQDKGLFPGSVEGLPRNSVVSCSERIRSRQNSSDSYCRTAG